MSKDVLEYITRDITANRKSGERGQIMTEFAIITVMCVLLVFALMVLFYYFTEYGERMLDLVSMDYP